MAFLVLPWTLYGQDFSPHQLWCCHDLSFPDDVLPFCRNPILQKSMSAHGGHTPVSHPTSSGLDKEKEAHVTFEEDKSPIGSFIGCIYAGRQALPELFDLHGVTLLHPVIAKAPEPAILGGGVERREAGGRFYL